MLYRIGSTGLGADALEKMRIAGLRVVDQHVPWFPNGMEATLGLDRCHNHDRPDNNRVELPIFLVARLRLMVGIMTYEANRNHGNYWASGVVQNIAAPFPAGYRPMLASEGVCALSQFPTLREIICGGGWESGGYCRVYFDGDGETMEIQGWNCSRPHARMGYVPLNFQGSPMPMSIT